VELARPAAVVGRFPKDRPLRGARSAASLKFPGGRAPCAQRSPLHLKAGEGLQMQSEYTTEWLSVPEAARFLRVRAKAVRGLILEGTLKANGLAIEARSVEQYMRVRRRMTDAAPQRLEQIRSSVIEAVRPSEEAIAEFREMPAEEWPSPFVRTTAPWRNSARIPKIDSAR